MAAEEFMLGGDATGAAAGGSEPLGLKNSAVRIPVSNQPSLRIIDHTCF